MATKNPFGNLKIQYDSEEEKPTQTKTAQPTTTTTTNNQALFNVQANDQKKKKKVRPDEKKKNELHTNEEEDNDGFSVVRKKGTTKPKVTPVGDATDAVEAKEHRVKNKGAYEPRNLKVAPGKREFERHSGTGRGKEISKGGAGGKYTWGTNPKSVPRDDNFNDYEDNYFNRALNPKKVEEVVEKVEQVQEVPVQEEKPVEQEEVKEFSEDRRRPKKGPIEEVNKEDLLERPKDALTVEEYKEQQKLKNAVLAKQSKVVERPAESLALNPTKKDDNQYAISLTESVNKKPKQQKVKGQKVDQKETEINKVFADSLKLEGDEPQRRDYGNKGYQKGKKDTGPKFRFAAEEFPEL